MVYRMACFRSSLSRDRGEVSSAWIGVGVFVNSDES